MRVRRLSFACLFVLFASCGGASAPPPETAGDTTSAGAPHPPPRAWAQMSHEDRQAWMSAEVVPHMSRVFAEYDGERYGSFGCRNCHGPNAREEHFHMPSRSLPALYPTGSPEQRQMVREYPEGVRCMFNRVVPAMQTLLGAPDFDASTGRGFSCYACHPHAGDEGTTPILLHGGEAGGSI